MIELVGRAEDYLKAQRAWDIPAPCVSPAKVEMLQQAQLRRKLSDAAGAPMIMATLSDEETLAFAQRADLRELSQQGPITPDHVIWTKRLPMLGTDVDAYVREYRSFCDEQAPHATDATPRLDPAPRVALDPAFGLVVAGGAANDAAIVADIYRHSMQVMQRSQALGGYRALSARELFQIEYWDLEQRKLRKEGAQPLFAGEIALVSGAASGIGKACVESLLARGAAVVGLDIDPAIEQLFRRKDFLGVRCDLKDERAVTLGLERAVVAYGGLDMLVLNAGIFPASRKIGELTTDDWRKVMAINLDANLFLLHACHPLLKLAPAARARRGDWLQERAGARPGRGGLFRLQGRTQPARARRRAGVGRRTGSVSTPCTRTGCSTPGYGPRRCCPRGPSTMVSPWKNTKPTTCSRPRSGAATSPNSPPRCAGRYSPRPRRRRCRWTAAMKESSEFLQVDPSLRPNPAWTKRHVHPARSRSANTRV